LAVKCCKIRKISRCEVCRFFTYLNYARKKFRVRDIVESLTSDLENLNRNWREFSRAARHANIQLGTLDMGKDMNRVLCS
jgi:hypothetical protein